MMLALRVGAAWNNGAPTGGTWLHGLVPFGGLEFSTSLQRPTDSAGGGGLLTVKWEMALSGNLPLPVQLRRNSLVELFAGPIPLGAAVISETPRGNTVTADGLFRLGEDFQAVDGAGLPTTDVEVAVQRAIGDGLRWVDPGDLPAGSLSTLSEDSVQFNTISALLNAYCKANNKLWHIDRSSVLRIIDVPALTSPDWSMSPLIPVPQRSDEDFASRWFVRRVDGVDADGQPNAWAPNSAVDPDAPAIREESEDLESLGYMTSVAGDAAAQALLDANKSRAAFVEGVQGAHGQLTTPGGTSPELWMPAAGDVMKQPNWLTDTGDLVLGGTQAWVIGGTRWKQDEPLEVTPFGMAPRSVAQVTQAQGGRTKQLEFS